MTPTPATQIIYRAEVEDSSRWQQFHHRKGDVFVCTAPKSGTTWTQAICNLLLTGDPDVGSGSGTFSPWIELTLDPMDDLNARMASQKGRRVIKSHSPFDGVIYWADVTYIATFRHPLDTYFSVLKHGENQLDPVDNPVYNTNAAQSFDYWLNEPFQADPTNNTTFGGVVHQYLSFLKARDLPNVHLFHYADMKRDLPGEMARFASVLDVQHSAETMAALAQAAGFDAMKANAEKNAPEVGDGYWKDKAQFFHSGSSNKWIGRLSAAQIAEYDAKIAAMMDAKDRNWLENATSV